MKENNIITIEYRQLNEPELATLEVIKKLAKSCRWINLEFRDNGENKTLQADFLREILKQLK